MCRERGQPCKSWPEFTLLAIINRGSRISFVSLLSKDFFLSAFLVKLYLKNVEDLRSMKGKRGLHCAYPVRETRDPFELREAVVVVIPPALKEELAMQPSIWEFFPARSFPSSLSFVFNFGSVMWECTLTPQLRMCGIDSALC